MIDPIMLLAVILIVAAVVLWILYAFLEGG